MAPFITKLSICINCLKKLTRSNQFGSDECASVLHHACCLIKLKFLDQLLQQRINASKDLNQKWKHLK